MARPPSQGSKAVSQDVMDLTRVLRRVESDTKRDEAEKEGLAGHLRGALAILLGGKRAGDKPVRTEPLTKAQKKTEQAAQAKRVSRVAADLAAQDSQKRRRTG